MKNKGRNCVALAICIVVALGITSRRLHAQTTPTPTPTPIVKNVVTSLGTVYCLDQDFLPVLDSKVAEIRSVLRGERSKGKFVGYISIPLSPTGGGSAEINKSVSADVKKYLEGEYGNKLWMLAPGAEEAAIPAVNGKQARGQEYMYMWTQVLGGEDGRGRDFDLFYFVGQSDFWRALKLTTQTSVAALEALADKAGLTGEAKRLFVSYYAFRASATASKGAHDEWNILRLINEARRSDKAFGIGAQISGYFDGRPVEVDDVESSVSAGYEGACK